MPKFAPCQYSDKLLNKLSVLNGQVKSPVDISEVTKAIYYARKYHGSQMRKSGELYYSHPIEVAYLFAEHIAIKEPQYFKTDLIVTALLHDTIEDTKLTKDMIAEIFNEQVADQVYDLTRVKFDEKITAGKTVNSLFTQYKKDVLHIKLFDRLHNIRTIGYMSPEKIKKIVRETIACFIPLATYLNILEVEQELNKLCIQAKSTQQSLTVPVQENFSFGNHPYSPYPNFQNVLKQIYTRK